MAIVLPKTVDTFSQKLMDLTNREREGTARIEKERESRIAPHEKVYQESYGTLKDISAKEQQALDEATKAQEGVAQWAEKNIPKAQEIQDFKPEPLNQKDMQAFGAIMTAFALIGSKGTLNPMVNAGNALAGAIEGYTQGNQRKFENDYKTYKVNFDKAVKTHENELAQYKEVLSAKNLDISAKFRRAELIAKGAGDTKLAMDFASHNIDRIEKELTAKQQQLDKVISSEEKMMTQLQMHYDSIEQRVEDRALRASLGQQRIDITADKAYGGTSLLVKDYTGTRLPSKEATEVANIGNAIGEAYALANIAQTTPSVIGREGQVKSFIERYADSIRGAGQAPSEEGLPQDALVFAKRYASYLVKYERSLAGGAKGFTVALQNRFNTLMQPNQFTPDGFKSLMKDHIRELSANASAITPSANIQNMSAMGIDISTRAGDTNAEQGYNLLSQTPSTETAKPAAPAANQIHKFHNREIVPNAQNTGWVYKDDGKEAK